MTYLVERLAELRRHLDHVHEIRPRVEGPESLEELEPIERFATIVAAIEAEGYSL